MAGDTWDDVSIRKATGGWVVRATRENKNGTGPGVSPFESTEVVVTDRTKLQDTIDELLGTKPGVQGGRR